MARARLAPQSCLTRDAREMYNVHVFGILLHIPTNWFIFLLPPFAPPAASSTAPVQCTRCIGGSRCWARSSQGCVRKEVDWGPAGRAWRRWSKGQCAVCSVFLYSRLHLLFFLVEKTAKKKAQYIVHARKQRSTASVSLRIYVIALVRLTLTTTTPPDNKYTQKGFEAIWLDVHDRLSRHVSSYVFRAWLHDLIRTRLIVCRLNWCNV